MHSEVGIEDKRWKPIQAAEQFGIYCSGIFDKSLVNFSC